MAANGTSYWQSGFIVGEFEFLLGSVRQMDERPGFSPRVRHTKDVKNGT